MDMDRLGLNLATKGVDVDIDRLGLNLATKGIDLVKVT